MNVYAYHVPALNAIKIGKGADPAARMFNYAEVHGLNPETRSLRSWYIGDDIDSRDIESLIHRRIGLDRLRYGSTRELFNLGKLSYRKAADMVEDIVDEQADADRRRPVSTSAPTRVAFNHPINLVPSPPQRHQEAARREAAARQDAVYQPPSIPGMTILKVLFWLILSPFILFGAIGIGLIPVIGPFVLILLLWKGLSGKKSNDPSMVGPALRGTARGLKYAYRAKGRGM